MPNKPSLFSRHPQKVAKDFKVHLRTIFRWIENNHLKTKNGRVTTNYSKELKDWRRSYPLTVARKKLKVAVRTLTKWRKRRLVETVTVYVTQRVLKSSVRSVNRRRELGTFSFFATNPEYGFPGQILNITGIEHKKLKELIESGEIPSKKIKNRIMIPNKEIERIEEIWRNSCTPVNAARILGKSRSFVFREIRNKDLDTVFILGRYRIELEQLAQTPEQKKRLMAYLASERKKYRYRTSSGKREQRRLQKLERIQRLDSTDKQRNRRFLAKREPIVKPVSTPIPDYEAQQVQVPGFETRSLTSCDEAAKATGRSSDWIKKLYQIGRLRGVTTEDDVFIYIPSLQIAKEKLRRGELR